MSILAVTFALLCIGDSITSGAQPWVERPWCEQLGGRNIGVGLTTTQTWLDGFDEKVAPHLAPDQIVHVLLGANDALANRRGAVAYGANLRALLRRLHGEGRRVVLSPQYRVAKTHFSANVLLVRYAEQVQAIWELGLAEPGAPLLGDPPQLRDGVHPTQAGHDHIARLLRPRLTDSPPTSRRGVAFVAIATLGVAVAAAYFGLRAASARRSTVAARNAR